MSELDPGAALAAAQSVRPADAACPGEGDAPVVHADATLDHDGLAGMEHFLAIIAHELRSPLNGIQSWAHVLASQGGEATALAQRALDGIGNGVRQQARVLEDLMDAMTVLRNNLVLVPRRLVLRTVLEGVLDHWTAKAAAKRVTLRADLQLGDACVLGDLQRVPQMIGQLLANAVRYTPADGWIDVTAWIEAEGDQPARAVIRVRDNGRGIALERLLRVFEPFCPPEARLETRLDSGVGLGLAMVRKLVAMHGGSVSASSAGPGCGATFVMRLPLLLDPSWRDPDDNAAADQPDAQAAGEYQMYDI